MERRFKVIVAGGQGPLKGKIIRIGHLGPITDKELLTGAEGFKRLPSPDPAKILPARKNQQSPSPGEKSFARALPPAFRRMIIMELRPGLYHI